MQNNHWRLNQPESCLCVNAKARAKKRGIEFNISKYDIKIPAICPLLEIPLRTSVGEGWRDDAPSLDRIDNSKGYIRGNVRVISKLANTMKSSATEEQLLTFARNLLKEKTE